MDASDSEVMLAISDPRQLSCGDEMRRF